MSVPGIVDDPEPPPLQNAAIRVGRALLRGIVGTPLRRLVGAGPLRRPGSRVAPDVAAVLALNGGLDFDKITPEQSRRSLNDIGRLADEAPTAPMEIRDLELEGPLGTGRVRLYRPAGLPSPSPLLVFIHGGGWVVGSVATHEPLCRRLAATVGCQVASVRYRLAPEAPFPAAVEDVDAAFAALASQAERFDVDPTRIAVGGDSAGGNLAAVVAAHARSHAAAPCLQVLIYPGVDATLSSPSIDTYAEGYLLERERIAWYLDRYAGDADRTHPDLSPLHQQDVSGVAPALVYTAGHDPLVDEGEAYARKLEAAGVEVVYRCFDDQIHGFANMAVLPSAHRALMRIVADLRAHLLPP